MLPIKNAFYILLLLFFSSKSFSAAFEHLTPSKTHSNIYFQYKASGNFRTNVDVYEITPDGWAIKDVLLFEEFQDDFDFQIKKVSVSESFLYVATNKQIIKFNLDVNGLPIQSSIVTVWESEVDSFRFLLLSENGSLFYTYDRQLNELSLYIANGDTYELSDQKSNVFLTEHQTSIHPDGSLIKDNSVYPLQGNKIGDFIHTSDLIEYVVHQDTGLGRNIFFNDSGDVIFKTNSFSDGGYVAKLSWPVAENDFKYTKLIETKNYSSDVNLGAIENFILSADKKWLLLTEFSIHGAEFHLFNLDTNHNVISHWYFDETWFSSNVENYDTWTNTIGFTPPIEVENSLWIGNLQLDINNPTQLLSVQNVSFLQIDQVTQYSTYLLYENDLIIIPESSNGAIRLTLDEQSNIISRSSQPLPIDDTLITGTSPLSSFDYSSIESDVFNEGNINNFSIHFNSQYSADYDDFFDANWIFDTIGFLDSETLVIHSTDFPHRAKVKKFPHTSEFFQKPLPELTLNQHDVLALDLAEYVTLPENINITLSERSNTSNNIEYEILYESTEKNIEFTVSKALALRQNNLQALYLEVHDNEWVFRALLPVTIENINEAPIAIFVEPQVMDKGDLYGGLLTEIFEDPDFDILTYNVTGLPNGLILSDDYISGSPTQAGTYTVTVTATDPLGLSTENKFDIIVNDTGSSSGGSFSWLFILSLCLVKIVRSKD